MFRDFPGGLVVKNSPASAGDTGSVPSLGRCLGATKLMCRNHWACILEPVICHYGSLCTLEAVLHNERSHSNEKLSTATRE